MKYSISAIPGYPLKDGGRVFLTCRVASRAISTFRPVVTRLVRMLLVVLQELLNGNYSHVRDCPIMCTYVRIEKAHLEAEWVFIGARRKCVRGCWCSCLHNSWRGKDGRNLVQDLGSLCQQILPRPSSHKTQTAVAFELPAPGVSHLMNLQFRPFLVRVDMVRMARAGKSGSAHALKLDLDTSNCRFSRKLQYDFARQEVEIRIMRVPAIQEDCCGHGGSRPGPRGFGLGLGLGNPVVFRCRSFLQEGSNGKRGSGRDKNRSSHYCEE